MRWGAASNDLENEMFLQVEALPRRMPFMTAAAGYAFENGARATRRSRERVP